MSNRDHLCSVDGCKNTRSSKLYCQKHHRANKLYGDPLTLKNRPVGDVCLHPGCIAKPRVKGLCDKHYTRLQRNGSSFSTVTDPRDITTKQRIKRNIKKDSNGCWIWQKGKTQDGYGQISVKGEKRRVHCLSYEEWVGEIPKGKSVCHKCDVRECCNPKHLFIGTQADNVEDMIKKGRKASNVGGKNGNSQLSEISVLKVFDMLICGVQDADIAKEFGISTTVISKIRRQERWEHVYNSLPEYKKKKLQKIKKKIDFPTKVFSDKDVLRIRRLIRKGDTVAHIARIFGVGETTIRNVRDGRTYTDV